MVVCMALVVFSAPYMPAETRMAYGIGLGTVFLVCMVLSDVLCATTALLSNQNARFGALALTVLCACGVGASVTPLIASSDPVLLGLCVSVGCAMVNYSILTCCVRDARIYGAVSVLWILALAVFLVATVAFLLGLPMAVVAAVMVALGVYGIQLMPNLVVHVPDRYLVQWREYMTQRWTVRGPIPDNARALSLSDIEQDMPRFLSRYDAGIVGCGFCAVCGYAMLLWGMGETSILMRVGLIALSVALSVFFELKPRQSGRTFERMMMRFLGLATLVMALMHMDAMIPATSGGNTLWAMMGSVLVGFVMVIAMLAQHGGFYSLLLSRIGDGLCGMSVAVLLPAAFFAAGGFELLRGGM